eukprot:TRINITY_DN372_c0_g1_i4.p2 TRINITY_DN372_c0_g1~~TRINITY_DN372_c0_g1_i4.p2  ORF type:complete len:348 (-),score=168.47 TRINITY_DN372_c0_g1_i4:113-1090(-)
MSTPTESQPITGVFVTNISPTADHKTIADFFSFCGKISSLSLQVSKDGEDGVQESVVMFESESAAKTAMLLTNAVIVDRSINVAAADAAQVNGVPDEAQMESDKIENKEFHVSDEARSKTSVVASLAAAGYTVGEDALGKAKAYDEKHMITLQLKAGAENLKAKAKEIDEQYQISATVQAGVDKVNAGVKTVDEKYGISAAATAALSTASAVATAATSAVVNKAMANETVAKTVAVTKEKSSEVAGVVKAEYDSLTTATKAEIEKRHAANAPPAAADADVEGEEGAKEEANDEVKEDEAKEEEAKEDVAKEDAKVESSEAATTPQ